MRLAPLAYILSGCGFEAGLIVKVAERIVSGRVGPMQDLTLVATGSRCLSLTRLPRCPQWLRMRVAQGVPHP